MTDIEQYSQILKGDSKALVNDLTAKSTAEPNNSRWTGKVVNNEDPLKLGRVQVKIIGYYENIQDSLLPWAHPDVQYMGSRNGGQIIPEIDSMVRGYFDNGDIQCPVYDAIAFNEYNSDSEFTDRQVDYPHKLVLFETDQGDFLTLNRRDGTVLFTHRTGAMFEIDSNGNVTINNGQFTPGPNGTKVYSGPSQTMTVTCNGDMTINVSGNCTVSSNGNTHIDSLGSIFLGSNPTAPVCNISNCFICGALHATQHQVLA